MKNLIYNKLMFSYFAISACEGFCTQVIQNMQKKTNSLSFLRSFTCTAQYNFYAKLLDQFVLSYSLPTGAYHKI